MANKKTYPKKPCPHCDKEVSTFHMAWAKHMKSCSKNPNITIDKKMAAAKIKPEKSDIGKAEFADDINKKRFKRAEDQVAKRNKAPHLFVDQKGRNIRKSLSQQYVHNLHPNASSFWSDEAKIDMRVEAGYIPAVDEHGQLVKHEGGVLMWRPKKHFLEDKAVASLRSAKNLEEIEEQYEAKKEAKKGKARITIEKESAEVEYKGI